MVPFGVVPLSIASFLAMTTTSPTHALGDLIARLGETQSL